MDTPPLPPVIALKQLIAAPPASVCMDILLFFHGVLPSACPRPRPTCHVHARTPLFHEWRPPASPPPAPPVVALKAAQRRPQRLLVQAAVGAAVVVAVAAAEAHDGGAPGGFRGDEGGGQYLENGAVCEMGREQVEDEAM